MNSHHRLNGHGLNLLTDFEKGPSTVRLSPGGAALEPYVCPGGKLTIGYGCTRWFGGRDLQPTDRLRDEAHARELLADQLIEYEIAVRSLVTVPLNSNQFSALVCFAFNVGIRALSSSTLLRYVNASRFDDAADAFGMWLYSTSGQHKQALRGLLRRRYSEACLWMTYGWQEACGDEAVALVRQRPPNNIGTDKVLSKTLFKDVLAVAQHYPLPPIDEPPVIHQESLPGVPTKPIDLKPLNEAEEIHSAELPELELTLEAAPPHPVGGQAAERPGETSPKPDLPVASAPKDTAGASPPAAAQAGGVPRSSAPTSPAPAPVIVAKPPPPPVVPPSPQQQRDGVNGSNTPGIDPSNFKSMLLSRRFWGLFMVITGRVVFAIWGTDTLLKLGSDPLVSEMVANVMVMMAASAWEYCGEMLHTWGKARAKRPLR